MFEMSWEKLQENLPQGTLQEKKRFGPDERFFKLSRGEDNRGTAIIRLLPDKNGIPFIKMFHHSIQKFDPALGKDRHYIEDSPQSIGQPCPVSEKWQELMKVGTEQAKTEAKLYSRKVKFITNIYIVKDPANPENNGKVMLWEFGTKLNEKFINAMNPSETDQELGAKPKELFNPLSGSNIMLKIKKAGKFFDYDDTVILDTSSIVETEEEAKALLDKTYSLEEFLSPEHYGTYDELKIKLDKVINGSKSKYVSNASQTANTGGTNVAPEATSTPTQDTLIEETKPQQEVKETVQHKTVDADDELDDILAELDGM